MRIRKRPAAPAQTPVPPDGPPHISINDGLQEAQPSTNRASSTMQVHDTAAAAVKPLKSLHLTTQSNSSNGNHKYPSIADVRQPLADRLQHHNGASCVEPANPKTAVCGNNPITQIPQSCHGLGLTTEHKSRPDCPRSKLMLLHDLNIVNKNSPASAPVLRVSSATSKTDANHHEQNRKRAGTALHSSMILPESMPELIIPANSTTSDIDSLQKQVMEKPLQEVAQPHIDRKSNSRKRRKTASSSNLLYSKLTVQETSISKEAARIPDGPEVQQTKGRADDAIKEPVSSLKNVSVKNDSSMNVASQVHAGDDVKPSISKTRKTKKVKKKTKSRKMIKNQQRTAGTVVRNEMSNTPGSTVAQCNRQDGRRWRCKKPVAPGYLYCVYHSAKMSKAFRLKLQQQQQEVEQQEQVQSTLQDELADNNNNNRRRSDHQLDLNVPIKIDGTASSSTSSIDDGQLSDSHKRRKLIQQRQSPVIDNSSEKSSTAAAHERKIMINSTQVVESTNRIDPISSTTVQEATNTNDNIRLNNLQGGGNYSFKQKPGSNIRGRWRKKCKPLLRKLNEIQDVVTAPPNKNSDIDNSTMELSHSDNDDAAAVHVVEDDKTDNLTENALNSEKREFDLKQIVRPAIDYAETGSTDSGDEETEEDAEPNMERDATEATSTTSCGSGDNCRSNYKITLTSTSDGVLSSSYVISQIQFSAFSKLLQAAAADSVNNFHPGVITGVAEQQQRQMNLYGNGASASPRTAKFEALPECVLNSDPCEWRSDLFS